MWLLVSFVLAQIGWNQLREFATFEKPPGQNFYLQSATVGGTRYKGALTVVVAERGLYLRPIWLFSFAHAPLLVPWQAFESHTPQKMMWLQTTVFTLRTPSRKKVHLTLESKALCAALVEEIERNRASNFNSLR
ncbi:hypothetical protein B1R32_10620 [Abditibacterium utsteinense]|uniref:Uncharacterized protein n=2 Tax=Abditibacterium utsteinense TaxID=1960156 RepID=A0A2S8STR7_9BACT|nr:hypothetical protein B1R32_10620 [Abditibacterium utsteinense]